MEFTIKYLRKSLIRRYKIVFFRRTIKEQKKGENIYEIK